MGYYRITRKQFYETWGGFSDYRNVRKQLGRSWSYWRRVY
jgi:hypothetical protein